MLIILSFLILQIKKEQFNPEKVATKVSQSCKMDSSGKCLKTFFKDFTQDHEFTEAKAVLDALKKINPQLQYCHTLAHTISVAEVKKDPQNWQNLFTVVPESECSYGFFHGVIEGKYAVDPQFEVTEYTVREVCLKTVDSYRAQRGCAHAFGHIVLTHLNGKMAEALSICHKSAARIAQPCIQGVFMENIQKENLSFHQGQTRPIWSPSYLEEQQNYCQTFKATEQIECWRSLSPIIGSLLPNDPPKMIIECQAKNSEPTRACIREVIGSMLLAMLTKELELEDPCKTSENYRQCISDSIEFTLLSANTLREPMSNQFCPVLKNSEEQSFCLDKAKSFFIN